MGIKSIGMWNEFDQNQLLEEENLYPKSRYANMIRLLAQMILTLICYGLKNKKV